MIPEFRLKDGNEPPDPEPERPPEERERHTRPILEAFTHAKSMIEMAVRYADLPAPPAPLPSGWAALLYLYDLR
jgi:hypothetical protein